MEWNWVAIGCALTSLALMILLFPRAKQEVENSPRGSMKDWMGYIVPMAAVALFILLLIALV